MMSQLNGIPSPETKKAPEGAFSDIAIVRTGWSA